MQFSCYIEINIICMLLNGILFMRMYKRRSMLSTPDKIMSRLLIAVFAFCVFDIVAILCRGRFFPGARIIIEASNILYLLAMPVISMLWCHYSCNQLGMKLKSTIRYLFQLPLLVFTVFLLCNPVHQLLFSINEANLYVRGPGIFLHWIISWFYLLHAGFCAWKAYHSATSLVQRNEYRPFLTFLILPFIACIVQMLFYGITCVQAGTTLSLVLVAMQQQDNQISTDALTGINNRMALNRLAENLLRSAEKPVLTVMMTDINHFKQINDTYGHTMGDKALCEVALRLKQACTQFKGHLFLCRFGGDEFVIIGRNMDEQSTKALETLIRQTVSSPAADDQFPYPLEISVGAASGLCETTKDFDDLLHQADEVMYEDKKHLR